MVLSFFPAQQFRTSAKKVFRADELHVTRVKDYAILILMTEGILRFREAGVDVELRPGEYYIQRTGLFQEGVRLGEMPVYYYVEFDAGFSEDANGLPLRGIYSVSKLIPLVENLAKCYKNRYTDQFFLNSIMMKIFSELYSQNVHPAEKENLAYLIRKYLDSNYAEVQSLTELSAHFGYTVDYIIRVFREQYGTTPNHYMIERRLDYAAWLLDHSELSIEQIAASAGYQNMSNFYRAFQSYYKQTPRGRKKQ